MSVGKIEYPVTLLYVVIKIFEKLVNNSFLDVLEERGLFSDFQCGFRSFSLTAALSTVEAPRINRPFNMTVTTLAIEL